MPLIKYCPNKTCKEIFRLYRNIESCPLSRVYIREQTDKKYRYKAKYFHMDDLAFMQHLAEVGKSLKEGGPVGNETEAWKKSTKIVKRTRHKQIFKGIGWFCTWCKTTYLDEDITERYQGPKELEEGIKIMG